jgi:hypothetical protein
VGGLEKSTRRRHLQSGPGTLSPDAFFDYNRAAVFMSLTGSLPLLNNFLAGGEAAGGCLPSLAALVCCDAARASAAGHPRPISPAVISVRPQERSESRQGTSPILHGPSEFLIWPHRRMALSVRGNPMMGGLKKIRPGFLDEGTKISLVPRGPIKYPSSGALRLVDLRIALPSRGGRRRCNATGPSC